MNYQKFTIENFRSFSEEQSLFFGLPQQGKIGSGITYIVGANNSGKTTLVEGMWMREGEKIRASEKKSGKGPGFKLYDESGELKRKVFLIRPESYTLMESPKIENNQFIFEIISSRRHWESNASGSANSRDILKGTGRGPNPRTHANIPTALLLKGIESDTINYNKFTTMVQKIIPEFTQWAVANEEHEYIEYTSKNGAKHKTDFLGDGVISVIRILAHLFFEDSEIGLIIDEPELSLHPLAQKKLIKLIAEFSQTRQIIISTHSPYFVSWEYIKNGAILNKVTKDSDSSSQIHTINNFEKYSKLISGGNWQQPYLMDVVSKEIFFQENILFVEGQEDVGLLEDQFKDCNINIFGYGVRGYQNFEFALELSKNLGIRKACVLLDSPLDPKLNGNENTIKENLEKTYGDKYKILQWNKADIRDKPANQTQLAKEGYFTEKGALKPERELDDFYEKIDAVKNYFCS